MKSKIVGMFLFVFLLSVKTSKCGGDGDMMSVSYEVTTNVRDNFMMTANDEDPEVINMRRILHRDNDAVIIVWKMEEHEAVRVDVTEYIQMVPEYSYVILVAKSSIKPKDWKIFYWVGDNSLKEDAVNAALFAYVLDSIVHPVVNFRREADGQESSPYLALFDFDMSENGQLGVPPHMDWEENTQMVNERVRPTNDEHNTRMILIEKNQISTVKEVEFSVSYLEKDDVCVVAFNSQTVYVYCGRKTMYDSQKGVAKKLARMIEQKSEASLRVMQIIKRSTESDMAPALDLLREEFKRISEAIRNGKEFDVRNQRKSTIIGQNMDILMLRIYQDKHDAVREEIGARAPINLHPFRNDDSFILDTCLRDVGMVVWLGHTSEIDEREGAVRRAELLIKERKHCGWRPILFVDETDKRIRSMRNKEKDLFSYLSNFVELMHKMNLSWEHFYELRELHTRVLLTTTSSSEEEG